MNLLHETCFLRETGLKGLLQLQLYQRKVASTYLALCKGRYARAMNSKGVLAYSGVLDTAPVATEDPRGRR